MNKEHITQQLKQVLLIFLLFGGIGTATAEDRPDGMHFIPDVRGQFRALTRYADPMGLHISSTPNPSMCRHYQGIARIDAEADGTPFFWVTRSGNLPAFFGADIVCDDSPGEKENGNLVVFKRASGDKNGERLRSNRLKKGIHVNNTPPPNEDVATIFFTVVGGDNSDLDPCKRPGLIFREGFIDVDGDSNNDCSSPPPHVYQHPGGMQRIGHVLAMATDTPRQYKSNLCGFWIASDPTFINSDRFNELCAYEKASSPSLVMFFDVSSPEDPIFLSQFVPIDQDNAPLHDADGIGVTPLPGGLYLMAITPGFSGNEPIYFYRSTGNNLADPNLTWEFVNQVPGPNAVSSIISDEDAHQSLHFIREGSIYGNLYLAGARGHPLFGPDHDRIDLFRVDCDTPDCTPGEQIKLRYTDENGVTIGYHGQEVKTFPSTGGVRLANLAAATGFYETPSGELLFYATEHDNDGPNGTVKMGEWRHQNMVREESPTLLPAANLDGPFEVDEGSSVDLTGTAEPPITRAWIQLFANPNFGGLYPVVDYDDYAMDDFDDFFALEYLEIFDNPLISHNDQAQSLKWYAPVGCSIAALDHADDGSLDEALTLQGTGVLEEYPDLSLVMNNDGGDNVNKEIDAVEFDANCDSFYTTPVTLQWDLDNNGSYETSGTLVAFSAADIDGPGILTVPVQAQHPAGGLPGTTSTTVTVHNVAPMFSQFRVTDSAGHLIGSEVPFVLTKLPVNVGAAFTDPGVLDHQTATLDWGDGTVEPQNAFTTFDEAFGDGTGTMAHTHRYLSAGNFSLTLNVKDDDNGEDSETFSLLVVTPEQAVNEVVALLNGKIAGEPNRIIKVILKKALKALVGSPPDPSNNGALHMIKADNDASAITFLQVAIEWLKVSEAGGTDVGLLISLLEQVILALSVP